MLIRWRGRGLHYVDVLMTEALYRGTKTYVGGIESVAEGHVAWPGAQHSG